MIFQVMRFNRILLLMKIRHNFDLEDRTFQFAKNVRIFLKDLPKHLSGNEDFKQLIRCSASVGANYLEANDSLGKKDFLMRMRISRKEAKECIFFIRLLIETNKSVSTLSEAHTLMDEANQLKKILSSIINKNDSGYQKIKK